MEKPITTIDLFNSVKSLIGKESAYAVGKHLGVTPEQALRWQKGQNHMSDEVALRAAKSLGLNPEYVLLCMHLEREKNETLKNHWRHIMRVVPYAACYGIIGFTGLVYFLH